MFTCNKTNNTAIFENSASRKLCFAVTRQRLEAANQERDDLNKIPQLIDTFLESIRHLLRAVVLFLADCPIK